MANVNLEECKKDGDSYRQLPKDTVKPIVSRRNHIADEVLNDDYICLCKGGEGSSTKPPTTEQKALGNQANDNINDAQQRKFIAVLFCFVFFCLNKQRTIFLFLRNFFV